MEPTRQRGNRRDATAPAGGARSASPDRYGGDVLAQDRQRLARRAPEVPADLGLVVEERETGWCGAVVQVEKAGGIHVVHLEDRHGAVRAFPLGPGFLLDGAPVALVAPSAAARAATAARATTRRTASGSFAAPEHRARVARQSRILVEGRHDAELVEKVWGADLRAEGVVVEMLDGVDDLAAAIAELHPGPGRRLGVLVDHLVPGSKESRIVEQARRREWDRHVLIVGHPFVDVWQSVRPDRLGWSAWPVVPRSVSWKVGVCQAAGWPHETVADLAAAWRRILGAVASYADLEPALLGRVEELIDFVTAG